MKKFIIPSLFILACIGLLLSSGCSGKFKMPEPARPVSSQAGKQVLAQIKGIMKQAEGSYRTKVDAWGIKNMQELTTNARSARQPGIKSANKVAWSQVKQVAVMKDDFLMPSGSASWWVQVDGSKLLAWVKLGYFKSQEQAQEMAELVLQLHRIVTGKAGR